ncbi:hypothetical protein [Gimesia maris]|uniref:Uncharacterized protein n=1 Tax=Gimesia maris TaxID=122 RepID=A0ABX5YQ70_9PLAN|nr:hypothetical protein [Gimesia maris]QDU15883.1 hypothetical protein CA11_37110 [Gimesia maris]QEG17909.1 hypothetical protein GmarT_37930 [Gimesia maris]QGQ29063.1 hypothetical protein F1729_10610 [Gimesia maris]
MGILVAILMLIGGIAIAVGGIWFIIVTFQESVLWGLGCLFIPFVSLIFLCMHWDRAGKPFLIQIAGLVPFIIGAALSEPGV